MKILHATDFSPCADQALEQAVRLARALGGEIVLAHVVPEKLLGDAEGLLIGEQELTSVNEARRRWAEEVLETRTASLRDEGLAARWRLSIGTTHEEIVKLAAAEEVDLIVMGTHGRGGFGRVFLGNVADRVIRTASCPVLTVRERSATESA